MSELCEREFYMVGNLLPFTCTRPAGHYGPCEWGGDQP